MVRRPTFALLAVALVVLAGCSAPVADAPDRTTGAGDTTPAPTTTTTPATNETTDTDDSDDEWDGPDDGDENTSDGDDDTSDGDDSGDDTDANESRAVVKTVDFETEYNATLILERVEALRGLNATDTIYVHETPPSTGNVSARDFRDRWASVGRVGAKLLQLYSTEQTRPAIRDNPAVTVERRGEVHIYILNASAMERRYGLNQSVVLAHEFVHALQFQHDLIDPSALSSAPTSDQRHVTRAVVEGDAVYVTEQYVREYAPNATISPAFYNRTPKSRWSRWMANVAYLQGYRHYRRTDLSPAGRSDFISSRPTTTGALFPGWPGEPAPVPSPVETDSLTLTRHDRFGPLTIRYALRANGMAFGEATEAVVGWRNGSVHYYSADEGLPVAWVTVWANESEASEFVTAWRRTLENNGATREDGLLVVPGTNTTPTTRYVIRQQGDTVFVFYAAEAGPVRNLSEAWADRGNESRIDGRVDARARRLVVVSRDTLSAGPSATTSRAHPPAFRGVARPTAPWGQAYATDPGHGAPGRERVTPGAF